MGDKPRIKMDDATTAQIREDGWMNVLSGYGTGRDPGEATRPRAETGLTQQALEDIYRGDGIGRRVVDLFAEEMTRKWIEIEGDQGEERITQLVDLEAKQQFNRALRWAGLYGGAVMVMLINDGQSDLAMPLNTNTVKSVNELIVYDRHQVSWNQESISTDANSIYFGRAEVMTIQPLMGTPYPIHRSRVLVFDGEDVPDRIRQQNNGWGDSRLQAVYRALGRYAEGMGSASSILRDFILPVLSMKNLSDMIASGQEDVVKKRLEILGVSKSMLNVLLIDADEEGYEKKASSVSGIDKLLAELRHNLCACTGIQHTKLFKRSAEGMNATGEGDASEWYDTVSGEQEDKLMPNLTTLVYMLDLAEAGQPSDRVVKCKPLWQMDEVQQATVRKTNVEAATMAVDYGLIDDDTAKGWVGE